MTFNISVLNKNSFGKDSVVGKNQITLDYILDVQQIKDVDFLLFHKKKEIGRVYLDLEYKDGTDMPVNHQQFEQNLEEEQYEEEEEEDENDLDYEYSPFEKPSKSDKKSTSEKVIAIDTSLSPLEANLALNKSPLWFKFNSSEVYRFNSENQSYDSIVTEKPRNSETGNGPTYLGSHMRATELPDTSFLITGGEIGGAFDQTTLHFYSDIFYQKSSMTKGRSNHSSVYHKGFVFWFGGRNEDGPLDEWEAFDMNTNQWVPIPAMPRKRFNAGWCKFGDSCIYIFGGTQQIGADNEDDLNISEIDFYDIENYQWNTLAISLNYALALPIWMQIGSNELLVMGGREGNGIWKNEVHWINLNTLLETRKDDLDLPCFSIYPPIYKNEIIYIQNSGTEVENVPDPMIYFVDKYY